MVGTTYVYIDTIFAFYGYVDLSNVFADFLTHLYYLAVWTHAFLRVLYVFYIFAFVLVQRN